MLDTSILRVLDQLEQALFLLPPGDRFVPLRLQIEEAVEIGYEIAYSPFIGDRVIPLRMRLPLRAAEYSSDI